MGAVAGGHALVVEPFHAGVGGQIVVEALQDVQAVHVHHALCVGDAEEAQEVVRGLQILQIVLEAHGGVLSVQMT
ncbi:hypothetical protein D3C71_2200810 [compost metagenome]